MMKNNDVNQATKEAFEILMNNSLISGENLQLFKSKKQTGGFIQEEEETKFLTLERLKKLLLDFSDIDEAYKFFISQKNVPKIEAIKFSKTYNPNRILSSFDSFQKMFEEIKGLNKKDNLKVNFEEVANISGEGEKLLEEYKNLKRSLLTEDFPIKIKAIQSRIQQLENLFQQILKEHKEQQEEEQNKKELQKQLLQNNEGVVFENVSGKGQMYFLTVINSVVHFRTKKAKEWNIAPELLQNQDVFKGYKKTNLTQKQALEKTFDNHLLTRAISIEEFRNIKQVSFILNDDRVVGIPSSLIYEEGKAAVTIRYKGEIYKRSIDNNKVWIIN